MKTIYESKIGNLLLESDGEAILGISFIKENPTENLVPLTHPAFQELVRWLDIYFDGKCPEFTPVFKVNGLTPFRKKVVDILLEIPYATTMTYKEIALKIAKDMGISKMSAQAVGGAVGWNPIGILIPCHRVIGSNGSLTGYAGGLANKEALLKLEGIKLH